MSKRPNPYGPEVEADAEGAPAIPLWIAGRAFLTMPAGGFFDLRGEDGGVRRRIPLCDGGVLDPAVAAASASFAGVQVSGWSALWSAWSDLLQRYSAHFASLLREERQGSFAAEAEVEAALAAFSGLADPAPAGEIVAVVATAEQPFAEPVRLTLQALAAGKAVILKPSVRCPSALLAFAELATRAGLPDGRLNVVHGDEPIIAALCARPEVVAVACPDGGSTAETIASMVGRAGKSH